MEAVPVIEVFPETSKFFEMAVLPDTSRAYPDVDEVALPIPTFPN